MNDDQRRPKPHDALPWREVLSQARTQPCPRCGNLGPHNPRCTPWVIHWGEVLCAGCSTHIRWLPKPPDNDQGAWKLYRDAEAKHRACHDLEAYLDSRGLRWSHESHGLLLVGAVDRPTFAVHDLSADERAHIKALAEAVRKAHGWAPGVWLWPHESQPSRQVDLFSPSDKVTP